jgi:hypothetical protein
MRRVAETLREPLRDDLPHLAHRLRFLGDGALDVGDADAAGTVRAMNRQHVEFPFAASSFAAGADAQLVVAVRAANNSDVLLDDAAFWPGALDAAWRQ